MSLLSIFLGSDKRILTEKIEGLTTLENTVNGFSNSINAAITAANAAAANVNTAIADALSAETAAAAASTSAAHAEIDAQTGITNAAAALTAAQTAQASAAHADLDAQSGITIGTTAETNAQAALAAIALIEGQNWNLVTEDTALLPGQVALYSTSTPVTSLPLFILTDINQVYELTVLILNPFIGSKLELYLHPNNNTYHTQFITLAEIVSGAKQINVSISRYNADSFYFIDGTANPEPPYARTLKIFTGNSNSVKNAMSLNSGGGSSTAHISLVNTISSWDNISTPYTSLGSLFLDSGSTANLLVAVRRII
jgi:hypothetical protein